MKKFLIKIVINKKNNMKKVIICSLLILSFFSCSKNKFTIDVETVIMSIGTSPNPLIKSTTEGLEVNRWGGIVVNEDGLTSRNAVYAGGDAVTGAATVISAMGAGKTAAKAIDDFLKK